MNKDSLRLDVGIANHCYYLRQIERSEGEIKC